MAYQPPDPLSKRPHNTILKGVPVGLLPLMCENETYAKPSLVSPPVEELPEITSRPSSSARNSPPTPAGNGFNGHPWVQLLPEYHNPQNRKVSPPVSPSTPPPSSPHILSPQPTTGTRPRPHFAFLPLLDPVPVEAAAVKVPEPPLPPPSPTPTDEHDHDPGLTTDETESDSHDESHDDSSSSTPALSSASRSRTPSPVESPPNSYYEPQGPLFSSPYLKTHEPRPSHLRTDCTPSILGLEKGRQTTEPEAEPDHCEFLFNYDDDGDLEPSLSRRSTPNAMAMGIGMMGRGMGPQHGYDYRRGNSYPQSAGYNPVLARSRQRSVGQ